MTSSKTAAIIGPTRMSLMEEKAGLSPGAMERAAREMGAFLAEESLGMVCVPVTGVPLTALTAYKAAGGSHSLALWPELTDAVKEKAEATRGNPELADRIRDDLIWKEAPFELARESDCLIAIGLSCGTMLEIIATKFIQRRPVLVLRPLMSGIPEEIAADLDLRYSDSISMLQREVKAFFGHPAGCSGGP
jgi:hypothetical protein